MFARDLTCDLGSHLIILDIWASVVQIFLQDAEMVEISIHTTLGFLFDAAVVGALLHGVALLQGWYYFRFHNKRDSWIIQILVGIVLLLASLQVITLFVAVYMYCITNYGNPAALARLNKPLIVELIFSGVIALLVQHFYIHRIYVLSKKYMFCVPLVLLSWGCFLTLVIFIGHALGMTFFAELPRFDNLSIATNIMGMGCDIGITLVTVFFLQRSKTGFRSTTNMINRLTIFTFNAGIPTTLCATLTVILLYAAKGTFAYIFVYVSMARFFANSLLVSLNSRDQLKGSGSEQDSQEKYAMYPNQRPHHRVDLASTGTPIENGNLAIRVETTRETYLTKGVKADSGSEAEMDLTYKAAAEA